MMDNLTTAVVVPSVPVSDDGQQTQAPIPVDPNTPKFIRANPLNDFLEKNGARRLWESQQPGVTVSCYSVLGTVVVATVFAGRNRAGWELYIPASKSGKVGDTLQAAAAFIGNGCQA